jgi:ABC-2 type transport system permease protein
MKQVLLQAVISPTLSTVLYFIVFGSALGLQVQTAHSIDYSIFIVPGLIMMAIITNALSASSSGIYFPRFTGTIIDLVTTPISHKEIILGYAFGATTRAFIIGCLVYSASLFFVTTPIAHPLLTLIVILLSAFTFSLLGIIVGIWAKDFEQLSLFPLLVVMPLSFLGGVFYSLDMLSSFWQKITIINPIYYMVDALRYAMLGNSTSDPFVSIAVLCGLIFSLWFFLSHLFSKGYGLRT